MKIIQAFLLAWLMMTACFVKCDAQKIISADVGYVHNAHNSLPGINVSTFYHFTEKFSAGIEMNRFFNHHPKASEEGMNFSAWDFDLNFHYNISLAHHLFGYPLIGLSHTSEKETNAKDETLFTRFYSFNTGAGVFMKIEKVTVFTEYMYTWGQINQQFFLAGIGYEFELGKK